VFCAAEGRRRWCHNSCPGEVIQGLTRSDIFNGAYEWFAARAMITAESKRGREFGSFGSGSIVGFPPVALYGVHAIHIGNDTLFGPGLSLSAGMVPGQELLSDSIVTIGDRCIIGRHSSIVGHFEIVIENDVFFGPNVYVTDQNHSTSDLAVPIGKQSQRERPVRISQGCWLGTNVVVLPGVTIGEHTAVGAGSVVTQDLPAYSTAVGSPARVIRTQS
jgi:serine acetyltransferase